jgi:hypothetical protein
MQARPEILRLADSRLAQNDGSRRCGVSTPSGIRTAPDVFSRTDSGSHF